MLNNIIGKEAKTGKHNKETGRFSMCDEPLEWGKGEN